MARRRRNTRRRRRSNGQFAGIRDEAQKGLGVFGLAALGTLAWVILSRPRVG